MATSGQIQPLKIPDAVVALAQAAAKANGETEKYLPGWPLFSPPKMQQLTKCAKCPREFCSSVAFRRHSHVHRRALKIDKDFPKNRDHVAAFWDKLTVDQAQTIFYLEDVVIEDIKGLSILTALSSWMCKPGYASLPLTYARAGNELLDLIQTAASRLPISSNELFSILDEASEDTFLCTNTADAACIHKYLFDGEAEKVATELKNVVACTSYILEQKLVEAWSADKAAEALRCQKLLVEEEDAAQKRQAEIMERKRMKKLRQKEQRLKDLKDEDVIVQSSEMVDGATRSPGIQSLESMDGPGLCELEDPQYRRLPASMLPSENNDFNGEDGTCEFAHGVDTDVCRMEKILLNRGPTSATALCRMDWSNLGEGLAGMIAERLLANDVADYVRFRAVCLPWRQCSMDPRAHGILDRRFHPRRWIMLRGKVAHPDRRCRLLNVSTGQCVRAHLPELRGHEVCAPTVEGLLVLLNTTTYAVRLLNPLTRQVSDLPPATTLYPLYIAAGGCVSATGDFTVSAAGLADDATVAVLFDQIYMLAVAKPGDEQWTLVKQGIELSPAISFAGRFYCTTHSGIQMVDIRDNQPPGLVLAATTADWNDRTDSRMLLDNDGELLLLTETAGPRIPQVGRA